MMSQLLAGMAAFIHPVGLARLEVESHGATTVANAVISVVAYSGSSISRRLHVELPKSQRGGELPWFHSHWPWEDEHEYDAARVAALSNYVIGREALLRGAKGATVGVIESSHSIGGHSGPMDLPQNR
jgi:hypothetical protein